MRKLADNYRRMGELSLDGRFVENYDGREKWYLSADEYYRQAEAVARTLVSETDAPMDKVLLGISLTDRGSTRLNYPDGEYSAAEPMLIEAIELLESQLSHTDVFNVRYYAVECNRYLSLLYDKLGNSVSAERYASRCNELSNRATSWEKADSVPIVSDPFLSK